MRWVGHVALTGDRRDTYKVWMGRSKRRDNLEDLVIDGTITLTKDLLKVIWGDKDYVDLVQNMDRWWAVVNAVMKLRVL
jgi:hypothetical protein